MIQATIQVETKGLLIYMNTAIAYLNSNRIIIEVPKESTIVHKETKEGIQYTTIK